MSTHIASVIVRARPELADAVAARISGMAGAEVHACEAGKIVAVLEASCERALADQMEALRDQPDVLMVSLVFHQMLEEEAEYS
jgi:nitrate reductase NapAB chaperone NapD